MLTYRIFVYSSMKHLLVCSTLASGSKEPTRFHILRQILSMEYKFVPLCKEKTNFCIEICILHYGG